MAKFRGTDIVSVLRGLSAVSRAAANVTEAELKEAWMSPSAQSVVKNWTINYKTHDLPKYAKEVTERSLAVAKGLKELSIISAQRYLNIGSFSPQPSHQNVYSEENVTDSSSFKDSSSPSVHNEINMTVQDQIVLTKTVDSQKLNNTVTSSHSGTELSSPEILDTSPAVKTSQILSADNPVLHPLTAPPVEYVDSKFSQEIHPISSTSSEDSIPKPTLDEATRPSSTVSSFSPLSSEEPEGLSSKGSKKESINQMDHIPAQPQTKPENSSSNLHSSPLTQPSVEEEQVQPAAPVARKKRTSKLSETSREVSVPSSRIGRLASYGSLAAGLGIGAIAEITRRTLGLKDTKVMEDAPAILDANPFLTEANAERIVNTLCKVRGAALKMGQMLSIQDNSLINPQLLKIFERVRESADFMPVRQMEKVLVSELGSDWRSKLLEFQDKPFAAASVGQVHLATLLDGREVAMKIQYPGVAKGIESDINNLVSILNVWNILPKGLYIEEFVEVAKRELSWEVDYIREAECTRRFRDLVKDKPQFKVPNVIDELCTGQVFTTEFVEGISMEQCMELDQETRNHVAESILSLCLTELFEFRFMQTDPNWANFMYNPATRQIVLIDFGASREYSKEFVDKYIKVIEGAAEGDRQKVLEYSQALGFLAGYETKAMEEAHVEAVMILGEAFRFDKPFDFGTQDTTRRIQKLIPVMLSQRLCPPPQESYSLHRKMSGAFLLCAKLGAKINCKPFFNEITKKYYAMNES